MRHVETVRIFASWAVEEIDTLAIRSRTGIVDFRAHFRLRRNAAAAKRLPTTITNIAIYPRHDQCGYVAKLRSGQPMQMASAARIKDAAIKKSFVTLPSPDPQHPPLR
jgi:hypothetical protein